MAGDNRRTLVEEQHAMLQFVKIIGRFPDIYNRNVKKKWSAERAWKEVVEIMKKELNLRCTVKELKAKWKGIRATYSRYKSKLLNSKNDLPFKKYYLYDALGFLERPGNQKSSHETTTEPEPAFTTCYIEDLAVNEGSNEYEPNQNILSDSDIKPDLTPKTENDNQSLQEVEDSDDETVCNPPEKSEKRKRSKHSDDENEDLQFFRSILPDIANFSTKEKRMLKVGVLKLIDDIENHRKEK